MSRRRGRLALLLVLLAVLAFAATRALRRVGGYRQAEAACAGLERGDWEAVLAATADLVGPEPAGLRAADCRCHALMELDRRGECTEMLEALLAEPAAEDWLPAPALAGVLALDRRDRGDLSAAADLAHRAAVAYPEEPRLLQLELQLQSRLAGEESALTAFERRLAGMGPLEATARVMLGERRLGRQEWAAARRALGPRPPADPELRDRWFLTVASSLMGEGRLDAARDAYGAWREAGGDPLVIAAWRAFNHSVYSLRDPQESLESQILAVLARADELEKKHPQVLRGLYARYISHLALDGRHQEALAREEEARRRFPEHDFPSREELMRSATLHALGEEGLRQAIGTLRFIAPGAPAGARLLLSPGEDAPHDAPYEEHPLAAGRALEVERAVGVAPQRWVLRDARGWRLGSGTVWPNPGQVVAIEATPRPPEPPSPPPAAPRPADGRRRVFVVILDCGDWRLVNYGRARGELPTLDHLVTRGQRAVVLSDPPYTATAVNTLMHPGRQGIGSLAALVHQLGVELAGNNFIGANPVEGLRWVLPGETDLFHELAARGRVGVNLLRSRGNVKAGRTASVVGPAGEREVAGYVAWRPLTPAELAVVGVERLEGRQKLLQEVAGDFDTLRRLVDDPGIDYVLLRVAALDLVTHGSYDETVRSGQDDGEPFLHRTYRYLDRRLGELWQAVDRDDVVVVMSDHGIRTAMEHDRHALFVAAGGDVPPGRVPGTPDLAGIPRMLAALLGLRPDWPATALDDWVQPPPTAPGEAAGD